MKVISGVFLFLFSVQVYGTELLSKPEDNTIRSTEDLISILEDTQSFIQPISPPSNDVYIEKKPKAYAVDFSGFDTQFTKYCAAYMDSNGLPRYPLLLWEDLDTREKVISLELNGIELARIPSKQNYLPGSFYADMLVQGAVYQQEMQWIFDPAHTAVSIELIPATFYSAYEMYQTTEINAVATPMISMAPPAPGEGSFSNPMSNVVFSSTGNSMVQMTSDTNSVVTMLINVPTNFGEHVEIFYKDNLLYLPDWDMAEPWLPTFGNSNVSWTDPNTGNKDTRYYIISDADKDTDGDGYSDLREEILEKNGNGPDVFDYVDTDGDGMHDWYEIKLFGDLDEDGSGDFDCDLLPNNVEMVYNSNTATIVWNSDPSLADTDGDQMDDYLETSIYMFLDPLDPSDGDYDHDGLSNADELMRGTSITNRDSDADTLADGMEVIFGTDPAIQDDLSSDVDGDGLVLSNEYRYGTDPFNANTDGGDAFNDMVNDGAEVAQGSSPTYSGDAGLPPDPNELVTIRLSVGDHSDSESEKYSMLITGERTIRYENTTFGNVESCIEQVRKGQAYTVSLQHIGTTPKQMEDHGHPDYDYTIYIDMDIDDPDLPDYQATAMEHNGDIIVVDDEPSNWMGKESDGKEGIFFAEGKEAKLYTPKVTLSLSQNTMTLKHDNQCQLNITTEPAELAMEKHAFQIRFKGETYWRDPGLGATMSWTTGVAGEFELRGRAKNSGKYANSEAQSAIVRFPTRSLILSDAVISAAMEAEWQQTLVDSTPSGYQERSFVVYLNTKINDYYAGSHDQSGLVPPGSDIYFLQQGLIEPDPLPNASGARYPVATFHTHTPEEFAPSNFPGRKTGPLKEDEPTAFNEKTPGFVYDYIESPIYSGYAETNNAMIYPYGPDRKELIKDEN